MVSPREESGAEIVEVLRGSVAEMAMLRVGDLITAVDGKPVKTPMELAAELQNRALGSHVYLRITFSADTIFSAVHRSPKTTFEPEWWRH